MKTLRLKHISKEDKQQAVLLGLVELYIKTGKPIGSNTLRENGFDYLSSATIRNYFAKFEEMGYLKQSHSSGGRIPKGLAFREYANSCLDNPVISQKQENLLMENIHETKEIATLLQKAGEKLSEITQLTVFFTSPFFDQDFLQEIKLMSIGQGLLAITLSDFGVLRTQMLPLEKPLEPQELTLLENFFLWRLGKAEKPTISNPHLLKFAQQTYNELLLRYVSRQNEEEFHLIGLSKLLSYPELSDPSTLANTLSFLEDKIFLHTLFQETQKVNRLTSWIGEELSPFELSLITIPYRIGQLPVGTFGFFGPLRLPYRNLFGILELFADLLSKTLTSSLYKFKITRKSASHKVTVVNLIGGG